MNFNSASRRGFASRRALSVLVRIAPAIAVLAACTNSSLSEPNDAVTDGDDLRRDAGATRDTGAARDRAPPRDSAPARAKLEANDVSILWPLPPEGTLPRGYLKLFPQGAERGPAIPAGAAALYDSGFHGDLPHSAVTPYVTISAMRADPCAPRATGRCVPELRISAQPFRQGLDDAATHLIYELSASEFAALRADLLALKQGSPVSTSGALGVHPGLAAGRGSAFASRMGDVVVRYATAARLARATLNSFANDNWGFRGVERVSGWEPIAIPLVAAGSNFNQAWLQNALHENLDDPNGVISPAPSLPFGALLTTGGATSRTPGYRAALDRVGLFRHPSKLTAVNSDCVSCHLAPQTALFYETRGATLGAAGTYTPPAGYNARVAVDPSIRGNLSNTIMFGWHRAGSLPGPGVSSVAQRVSFDTAEVLKAMGDL